MILTVSGLTIISGKPKSGDLVVEAASVLKVMGLTDVERFVLMKAYISDFLTLKAYELAFREGHIALMALFGFGVIISLI